jgi:hypothetical protein
MCQSTLAIYCFIDDLLKAMQHKEDSRTRFSDAEVITTALIAMLYFGGNFERSRSFLKSFGWCPQMLSRSRFSRRLNRLSDLIQVIFHQLGMTLKELNYESRYTLDSFPVPLCDNMRIKRNRLTKHIFDKEQYRGKITSKRRYFFGVKVQVITTVENLPVEFSILPGSCSDLQGLAELPLEFSKGSEIAADAAYTEYEWEDYLLSEKKIKLLVSRKRNSKRGDGLLMANYKFWLRHRIETTFGEIEKLFPKKIHATTLSGFLLKIVLFLLAFQIDKAFIQ